MGCSSWGCKESDMTERLRMHVVQVIKDPRDRLPAGGVRCEEGDAPSSEHHMAGTQRPPRASSQSERGDRTFTLGSVHSDRGDEAPFSGNLGHTSPGGNHLRVLKSRDQ